MNLNFFPVFNIKSLYTTLEIKVPFTFTLIQFLIVSTVQMTECSGWPIKNDHPFLYIAYLFVLLWSLICFMHLLLFVHIPMTLTYK